MIKVLCLNPTIDRVYHIQNFKAGTQYHGNIANEYIGGKGINVAHVLKQLGDNPLLYCFLGGRNGSFIEEGLEHIGVPTRIFNLEGETRMTINIIDRTNGKETEITELGSIAKETEIDLFLSELNSNLNSDDIVIASGLPANGMKSDIYKTISTMCESKKAKCIMDANGKYLESSFPSKYFFIKPNETELGLLFNEGKKLSTEKIVELSSKLIEMGVENVLITRGANGAIFINKEKKYNISVPNEPILSTIGCGDSTVAGFCFGYTHNMSIEECLRLSMATGISNAKIGKIGVIDNFDIEELIPKISLKPL